jgi:hypothetical protein
MSPCDPGETPRGVGVKEPLEMLKSFNETHHAELFDKAREGGAGVGEMVRTHGWVAANMTIARAATGFVNRLPLDNIKLETELRWAFIAAAEVAANAEVSA